MNLVSVIFGLLLLLAGRRLYWLFVAGVGFWVGSVLAHDYLAEEFRRWAMLIAVLGGIVGAILAIFFQKVAVALAGAAGGGLGGWILFDAFGAGSAAWIGVVIGVILGAILVLQLFDWGLIVVSSVVGAGLLVGDHVDRRFDGLIFLGAALAGIIVQGAQLTSAKRRKQLAERKAERAG
jgi:hypothetical protein